MEGDQFGVSVALSDDGNTAIVGALFDDIGGNVNQGSATIFVLSGSVSLGAGSVSGVQPVQADVDIAAGVVSFVPGSDLRLTFDGLAPDTGHTQLNVAGAVNLTGANLVVVGSHVPTPGEAITLVTATSVTGIFNGRVNNSFVAVNGFQYRINYTATSVVLTATASTADVYIDDDWAATPFGTVIVDADLTTPGNQTATFGVTAFASAFGLESVGTGKTVTLFAGTYPQNAALVNPFTLRIPSGTATLSGALSGNGGLAKTGNGTLVLSGTNTFTGGVNVSRGKLQFAADANLGATANPIAVVSPGEILVAGNVTTGRTFDLGDGTLTVNPTRTLTLAGGQLRGGTIKGPGTIATTVGHSASFVGTTFVNSLVIAANGSDTFQDASFASSVAVAANGTVTFENTTNAGAMTVAAGSHTVTLIGTFVNESTGRLITGAGSTTNVGEYVSYGTTTISGSLVNASVGVFSLASGSTTTIKAGGTLDIGIDAAYLDVAAGATLNVSGTVNAVGLFTQGLTNVASGGSIVNVGDAGFTFSNGSTTFVLAGGEIGIGSVDALVVGGLVRNFGEFGSESADVVVDVGGSVSGPGTFYSVVTQNGGIYSPGASPGGASHSLFEINGGGFFDFEITNATGAAGNINGWDTATVAPNVYSSASAELAFTATPTHPYSIRVTSLLNDGLGQTPGAAANFNPAQNYAWKFVDGGHVATTVSGAFDPDAIQIFTAGFQNNFTGTFSVELRDSGKNLYVVYTAPVLTPTVTSMTPVIGPTTGGTLVTIFGANFTGITTVTFDGFNAATFTVISGTQINAVTAAHVGVAPVEVVVTNSAGFGSLAGTDDFTFAPSVSSVVVNGGPGVVFGASTFSLAGQHSVVRQLLVAFQEAVTVASDAFTVTRRTQNVTVNGGASPSTVAVIANSVTMISASEYLVTLTGEGTHVGGVINSGVYDLTTLASKVTVGSQTMAANQTTTFFALFGNIEANNRYNGVPITQPIPQAGYASGNSHTKVFVDPGSLFRFSDTFGSNVTNPVGPPAYDIVFDYNLDGSIDPGDLFAFSDSFGIDWAF